MAKRIYLVANNVRDLGTYTDRRLVEAHSQAQAIRHVVRASITCAVATPAELVELTKAGVEVEKAGE